MTVSTGLTTSLAVDEDSLMAEVGAGSVVAFGMIYDAYCDRAYRVARSVCRDDGRAQDAVQDAFISIWRGAGTYQAQRGAVSVWLLTVVRHRAIDLERQHARHEARRASERELHDLPATDDVSEQVINLDLAERLRTSLATLPEGQQEVIALAFYGQLSHTEIATRLGLPPGTVKGRMRLGLHKLNADQQAAEATALSQMNPASPRRRAAA